MNIQKLARKAVRKTRKIEDLVHLSDQELRQVIGGDGVLGGGPVVDPETCAIHFYYPADALD
ncbi:MAG: hypothetical protein AAF725_21145 [Acidobacteriota bacterium]